MRPQCDYLHDDVRPADWGLIGEAGDYFVCDEHFQMRTEEGKRGWSPLADWWPIADEVEAQS